jgi:WD40 repeat protein
LDGSVDEFMTNLSGYAQSNMDFQYTGASKQTITSGHNSVIFSLVVIDAFTGTFASGSYDQTIKLWSKDSSGNYRCVQTLTGHDHYVTGLVTFPDGSFASGSYDNTIKIWKKDSTGLYTCIQTIQTNYSYFVLALIRLPDNTIASATYGPEIKIYGKDTSGTYQLVETINSEFTYGSNSLTTLSDGSLAAGNGYDGTIKLFKKNSSGKYQLAQTLTGHTNTIKSMIQLTIDTFASASTDLSIKVWRIKFGKWECVQTIKAQTRAIYSLLRISSWDGSFASGSLDNTIYLWRLNSSGQYENYQIFNEHTMAVSALIKHPDQTIISASYDKTIKVWA